MRVSGVRLSSCRAGKFVATVLRRKKKMNDSEGPTRPAEALTHRTLEALRAGSTPYRVPDVRCPGLAIRVATSGLKTWDLAYRIKGDQKVRRRSLGRFPEVSLDDARQRAESLTRA